MEELGIGSRIRHPEFGIGVVINVKPRTYITVFTERGKIEVAKTYQNLEVIDAQPPVGDPVSFATWNVFLPTSLKNIQTYRRPCLCMVAG